MKKALLAAGSFLSLTAVSLAQEPTDFDTFLTTLQTQVTDSLDKIWPVLSAILVVVLGFFIAKLAYKYIKQFANR